MDGIVDVVESRGPEGFGFLVKVRTSGQLYRIAPARDPRQPRFWCMMIFRCSSAGVADATELPWLGAGGMSRDELPEKLGAIRADVDGWLAEEACGELRRWILEAPPVPALPAAQRVGRARPVLAAASEVLAPATLAVDAPG